MNYSTAVCFLMWFTALLPWCSAQQAARAYDPIVPKVWDDAATRDLELPLARAEYSPKHVPASFYYQIPVRPIYKSYPSMIRPASRRVTSSGFAPASRNWIGTNPN